MCIHLWRHGFEMAWPNTPSHMAEVIKVQPFPNLPRLPLVRDSMGQAILPVQLKHPVPSVVPGASPKPAGLRPVNFLPEPLLGRLGWIVNSPVPANAPVVHLANGVGVGPLLAIANCTKFHRVHLTADVVTA